jgi:hypothetical protein
MPKKPTSDDAQLILQLYDFRRETEMRKARTWWATFSPRSADDVIQVMNNSSSQENAWFRQVSGYWDMASVLVLSGALNEDLFTDINGEMWFIYAKVSPFIEELRKKSQRPQLFARIEKLAKKSKVGRERLKTMENQFAARRKAVAAKSS